MDVVRYRSPDVFDELAGDWDRLAAGKPFRGRRWLEAWWRHYSEAAELFVLVVRDAMGCVRAIAPLRRTRSLKLGRVLEWLGTGEICSEYLGVACASDDAPPVSEALAAWLFRAAASEDNGWDLVRLESVDFEEATVPPLVDRLAAYGCPMHCRETCRCWRIPLPAGWDAYLSTLSKSHRRQIRRLDRKYLASGRVQFRQATTSESWEFGWHTLVDLHQRRRARLGQAGCFASARFANFVHQAGLRLWRHGQARLAWIDCDGRPVAAELHLVDDRVCYAFQAGLEPDAETCEPGRLFQIAALQRAWSDGLTAWDLLRGDEPYKPHWRAVPRPSYEYRLAAPRAVARARHRVWLAGLTVKQWVYNAIGGASHVGR